MGIINSELLFWFPDHLPHDNSPHENSPHDNSPHDISPHGHFAPRTVQTHGQFAPRAARPTNISPHGHFAPWTARPMDSSPHGQLARWTTRPMVCTLSKKLYQCLKTVWGHDVEIIQEFFLQQCIFRIFVFNVMNCCELLHTFYSIYNYQCLETG